VRSHRITSISPADNPSRASHRRSTPKSGVISSTPPMSNTTARIATMTNASSRRPRYPRALQVRRCRGAPVVVDGVSASGPRAGNMSVTLVSAMVRVVAPCEAGGRRFDSPLTTQLAVG
jgi:hypothetical protein